MLLAFTENQAYYSWRAGPDITHMLESVLMSAVAVNSVVDLQLRSHEVQYLYSLCFSGRCSVYTGVQRSYCTLYQIICLHVHMKRTKVAPNPTLAGLNKCTSILIHDA